MDDLQTFLAGQGLLPHGYCIAWSPGLLWTLVSADALIAAAYYSIPLGLFVLARRRRDLAFHWMFYLFAFFILACGTTHLIGLVSIWVPIYRVDATIKVVTAGLSVLTAMMLWPLIPKVLALPSPRQMAEINHRLEAEVESRRRAEDALRAVNAELEERVAERTRELQFANDRLAHSNRELEQFAYVASHDLQEPLRMVSAYGQLLERRYAERLDGDAREFLGFMTDGARRLQGMIDDLLALSRASRGPDLAPASLESALERATGNLALVLEESGANLWREPLPQVMGDENQLTRLFQNLLSNAVKFRAEAAPDIRVAAVDRGQEWLVSVSDNGIGIDPKYSERIFAAFQRLHGQSEYPGSGIGLTLCKRIVERHGGRIWVESAPGRGATFFFSLRKAAA
jgi:signal transduction histidine kinase